VAERNERGAGLSAIGIGKHAIIIFNQDVLEWVGHTSLDHNLQRNERDTDGLDERPGLQLSSLCHHDRGHQCRVCLDHEYATGRAQRPDQSHGHVAERDERGAGLSTIGIGKHTIIIFNRDVLEWVGHTPLDHNLQRNERDTDGLDERPGLQLSSLCHHDRGHQCRVCLDHEYATGRAQRPDHEYATGRAQRPDQSHGHVAERDKRGAGLSAIGIRGDADVLLDPPVPERLGYSHVDHHRERDERDIDGLDERSGV
jgi:hypothetical protein